MDYLENYYSGDENWLFFSSLYEEFWIDNDISKLLLKKMNNNLDIAYVIYGKFENNSISMLNQKIPALNNLSITDCLEEEHLIKRLKECLMRMPF